jgi:hypothetical protein
MGALARKASTGNAYFGPCELVGLQEQAAEYIRESKRRDALEPDELISAVIDAVARDYFQHVLRKNLWRGGS